MFSGWQNHPTCPSNRLTIHRSWKDRIQSVFLFEIAISIDNFQEKMTRAAMRHLRGVTFEASGAEHTTELMFKVATSSEVSRSMWIGPGLSKALLDRQLEHIQSGHAFIQAFKVSSFRFAAVIKLIITVCLHDALLRQPIDSCLELQRSPEASSV